MPSRSLSPLSPGRRAKFVMVSSSPPLGAANDPNSTFFVLVVPNRLACAMTPELPPASSPSSTVSFPSRMFEEGAKENRREDEKELEGGREARQEQ